MTTVPPVPSIVTEPWHRGSTHLAVPAGRVLLVGLGEVLTAGMGEILREGSGLVVDAASGPRVSTDGVDVVVCGLDDVGGLVGPGHPAVLALVPPGPDDLARLAVERGADGVLSIGWTSARMVEAVLAATEERVDTDEPDEADEDRSA